MLYRPTEPPEYSVARTGCLGSLGIDRNPRLVTLVVDRLRTLSLAKHKHIAISGALFLALCLAVAGCQQPPADDAAPVVATSAPSPTVAGIAGSQSEVEPSPTAEPADSEPSPTPAPVDAEQSPTPVAVVAELSPTPAPVDADPSPTPGFERRWAYGALPCRKGGLLPPPHATSNISSSGRLTVPISSSTGARRFGQ